VNGEWIKRRCRVGAFDKELGKCRKSAPCRASSLPAQGDDDGDDGIADETGKNIPSLHQISAMESPVIVEHRLFWWIFSGPGKTP